MDGLCFEEVSAAPSVGEMFVGGMMDDDDVWGHGKTIAMSE